MFRAVYRSSSGALTVFAASGLHTHVVTGRSQVWLRLDYGRSPHAYVNQRLQIQLELLMMRVFRSKHVEPLMNGGIINSVTRLHLVGYFYWLGFLHIYMIPAGISLQMQHLKEIMKNGFPRTFRYNWMTCNAKTKIVPLNYGGFWPHQCTIPLSWISSFVKTTCLFPDVEFCLQFYSVCAEC